MTEPATDEQGGWASSSESRQRISAALDKIDRSTPDDDVLDAVAALLDEQKARAGALADVLFELTVKAIVSLADAAIVADKPVSLKQQVGWILKAIGEQRNELRERIAELERDLRTERTWREEYEGRGEARGTDG